MHSVVFSAVHLLYIAPDRKGAVARRSRKKRVTLKHVAERAGVSLKTASNVKNNWPYVSDETRAKVKRVMLELGYRPSRVARSLVTGRTETVGIVVPDITNPFFSAIIRGCEDQLLKHGYSLFLCNTDEDTQREEYYINLLVSQGVDGLLLFSLGSSAETLGVSIPEDLPTVAVDVLAQDHLSNLTAVRIDNAGGARAATVHLLSAGRHRIAFLKGKFDRFPARERQRGFRQAMEQQAIPTDDAMIAEDAPTIGGGYQAALQALDAFQPDALFCFNDLMALGALAAANTLQLSVPDDIALVGFDDIVPALLVTPMLTTVRIQQYELGRYAVRLLMERIQDESLPFKLVSYPVELQVRESCGMRRFSAEERQDLFRQLIESAQVNLPDAQAHLGKSGPRSNLSHLPPGLSQGGAY
jgi:LacI family transcriptional regulator